MKRIKWVLAAFVLTLIFFGCSDGNGGGDDEEFNEEDFYVTDQVIGSSANQAGLSFLATPDISLFADQIETAHDNRFTWSVGNLAQISGSSTNFITGKTNQLATTGSGFQFSINTKAVNTDALRPAIGFGAIFMFTAESNNLGTTYSSLRTALEALPQYEGGWVMPEASVLTGLGIKVFTMHGDTPQDITDRISYGMRLDENAIMISYGAVMVDRAISDFSQEGQLLPVSEAEERIWGDGILDGKITGMWWIGKTN